MIEIPQYKVLAELNVGAKYSVYKAERIEDKEPVVIKTFSGAYPSPHDIIRLKQESEFSGLIESEGIIKTLALEHFNNKYFLVMQSIEGISLKQLLRGKGLEIEKFLNYAVTLAATLGDIHAKNVIHKDIKPSNIIVNEVSGDLKITDFGIATILTREATGYSAANALEGTLAYISPEQTGRMNRSIDYRSDLYSLGVTFYEMLTGKLPFDAGDSIEIVHSHIALEPPRVESVNDSVPKILGDIIYKLMMKNAEDRYQSAQGLKLDLEACLEQLRERGRIESFALGNSDYSGRFQVLQKLYGRGQELTVLMEAFGRASQGGAELLLVGGYSGVGKTALVNETHKPITEKNGIFISGKFDQYQRDVPYFAVRQAFNGFCDYLISETEEVLSAWRAGFLRAVGERGQVLIDIIPNLELVIGEQSPVQELSPTEAQNRLIQVFEDFIGFVCQKEHPLTFFIDDMQWADSGSLNLLEHLIADSDTRYLFIICAYRDNEVDAHHPFVTLLEEVRKKGAPITEIELKALKREDVGHLVSDALKTDMTYGDALSELIFRKTDGNAFFVNQFLKALYSEDLLSYSFEERTWKWDMQTIESRNVTDNVVELMAQKITRLNESSLRVIQFASCMGNKFNLKILSIICEKTPLETLRLLWSSVDEGFVVPLDRNYKLLGSLLRDEESMPELDQVEGADSEFRFIHDRVQEASYATIAGEDTDKIHLEIARLLHGHIAEGEREERIFDIVNQYEKGYSLLKDRSEIRNVADLFRIASRKALSSSAFNSAMNLSRLATEHLLDKTFWQDDYDLIVNLYKTRAVSEYSAVKLEESVATIDEALAYARGEDEIVFFYKILSRVNFQLNRHHEGNRRTNECLAYLGVKVPRKVNKLHIGWQYLKFRLRLGFRKTEELMELPEMEDRHLINICRILFDSVESNYMVDQDAMGYNSVLMANICLRNGNSIYAPFAYGMLGIVMAGVTKELRRADRYSRMSLELNDKYPSLETKGRLYFLYGNFTLHWTNPIEEHLPLVKISVRANMDIGSLHWCNYATFFSRFQSVFFNQDTLSEIIEENKKQYSMYFTNGDIEISLQQNHNLNFLYWLSGKKGKFENEACVFDEDDYEKVMAEKGNVLTRAYYHGFNMIRLYMQEDYEQAFKSGWEGFRIVHDTLGVMADFVIRFYYLLVFLRMPKKRSLLQRIKVRAAFRLNLMLLAYYAKTMPDTYLPYYRLVQAEQARCRGKNDEAGLLYDESIRKAGELEYRHIAALANELAGKFYLDLGRRQIASAYMTEAHYIYAAWGARAMVRRLERKYGEVLRLFRQNSRALTRSKTSSREVLETESMDAESTEETQSLTVGESSSSMGGILDLGTVMKVTQMISGEIRLDVLLGKMMRAVIENAGAQTGLLILSKEGKFYVEARGEASRGEDIQAMAPVEIDDYEELPLSIVNYTARTRDDIVISDAVRVNQFENDVYIKTRQPRSILCSPIINQGRLVGMIYLENNLTTDAFTEERIRVLNMISSQAAISLENAVLYNEMEAKVEERTRENQDIMSNVQQGIFTVNREHMLTGGFSGQVERIFENVNFKRTDGLRLDELMSHDNLNDYLDMMFDSPFASEKMITNANPIKWFDLKYADPDGRKVAKKIKVTFSRIFTRLEAGVKGPKVVDKLMVVVDDRTAEYNLKQELQSKEEEQRKKIEKLYQILSLDSQVFTDFLSEARNNLDEVNKHLSALGEDMEANRKLIDECFREVHTLKGNARSLNLESIGDASHLLEDEFEKMREGKGKFERSLIADVKKRIKGLIYELKDGNALFGKILNMQKSLNVGKKDPFQAFEERIKDIVAKESEILNKKVNIDLLSSLPEPVPEFILKKLRNPLGQLVRNAIFHGIEKDRSACGKPDVGVITLKFARVEENYVITCEDDGGGLNHEAIKAKALSNGIITQEEAASMSKKQISPLIFHSGMSTAGEVNEIAGRGVGMDIVKKDLRELKARLGLRTEQGKYTRFIIRLPA